MATTTANRLAGDELWARVPVTGDVDLRHVRSQVAGPQRRSAAIDAMRAATSEGAAQVLAALRAELAANAATRDARIAATELLWLDGSMVLRAELPDDAPEARATVLRVLGDHGGVELDGGDLPSAPHEVHAGPTAAARSVAAASTPQWYAEASGFDAAHRDGLDGRGVRVAVVDSGVDASHPDLAVALGRGGVHDRFAPMPVRSGHGTFVAGILAGRRTGLAPGVSLLSSRTYGARFGDHRGEDPTSRQSQRANTIRALQDALAPPDGSPGADVVVASWGILDAPGIPAHDYDRAMATLAAAGAVVVAAAGNDGSRGDGGGTIAVPAQLDDVLAVGGVDRTLAWHPKVSTGPSPRTGRPKPDLAAPVVDIRSTAPGGQLVDTSTNPDRGFAGTSAAAPAAAALVALLAQAIQDRGGHAPDIDEVRGVLDLLTRDVDAPGPDPRTGAGTLDATLVRAAATRVVAARASRAAATVAAR